jgi:hypothetical protein
MLELPIMPPVRAEVSRSMNGFFLMTGVSVVKIDSDFDIRI